MTGLDVVLGALAGTAVGALLTGLRLLIVRRLAADPRAHPPSVPPSADVLDAERRNRFASPFTTTRRPR